MKSSEVVLLLLLSVHFSTVSSTTRQLTQTAMTRLFGISLLLRIIHGI